MDSAPQPPGESEAGDWAQVDYSLPRAWSRDELIDFIRQLADQAGTPRLLPLAATVGEANLDQFAERYGGQPVEHVHNFIELTKQFPLDYPGNWGEGETTTGREAWARIMARANEPPHQHDVSAGVSQQIYWYAPPESGADKSYSFESVMAWRRWMFEPENALPLMLQKLAQAYHPGEPDAVWRALNRYNWPAGDGNAYNAANGSNYRRAIATVQRLGLA